MKIKEWESENEKEKKVKNLMMWMVE